MGIRKLGDIITLDFTTHNPFTGAVQDTDSLPTCEVFEDENDSEILIPIVTKRVGKIGNYRVSIEATIGNGFEIGKSYNTIISATVNNISAKSRIESFVLDSKRINDLNDVSQTNIDLIKLETDKIQPEILDKKNEFKADISVLSLETTSQTIKDKVDSLDLELDGVAKESTLITKASQESIDLVKNETDKIQPEIIEKKNEFKADISTLALEETVQDIKDKTDLLPTDPTSEANATTNKEEIIEEVNDNETKLDLIKTEVDKIELIKQMETGKWKIEANQMIFYKDDNSTEIARFNLFDEDGNPSMTDVIERRKVE